MGAAKTTETVKQITHLAGALKAPRITQAASRLADQARDAGWSFEDYLAAVLAREVSARNASGAELRIRAAGFPARKTLEDFDWDTQPAARQQIASLASGALSLRTRRLPEGTRSRLWPQNCNTLALWSRNRTQWVYGTCATTPARC